MADEWHILDEADEVTDAMLDEVDSCVDGWFMDGEPLTTEAFIDRFASDYLYGDRMDIEDYDCPAVRKIMKRARAAKREMAS